MFTPDALYAELQKPYYADAMTRFTDAATHGGQVEDVDANHELFSRYYPTDELQQMLNTIPTDPTIAAEYVKAPLPYDGAVLGRSFDLAEIAVLPEFPREVLLQLMSKMIDLGDSTTLADLSGMLAASPNSLGKLQDAAQPKPCTPVEFIGARNDVATHNDILGALRVN